MGSTAFGRLPRWAPVRLLLYAASVIAMAILAKVLTQLLVPPDPSPLHAPLMAVRNLLLPIGMFAVYAVLVHRTEHRAATELDLRKGAVVVPIGLAIGVILICAFYLILWMSGMARFAAGTGGSGLTTTLIYNLATAMGEELLFRAVLFRLIEEVSGTTVAVLVSAAIFGIAHLGNDGATPFTISALTIELGVLLALAYVLTRNVWFVVGIHLSWNFTQGYLLGAEVSGARQPHHVLATTLAGPDLLTGGSFGPEGSLVLLGLSVIASVLLMVLIRRKNDWQPIRMRWRLA